MLRLFIFFILISLPSAIYAADSDFKIWLECFKKEAIAQKISRSTVDMALNNIRALPTVVKQKNNQPEVQKTLEQYLNDAINEYRIRKGKKLLRQHQPLLDNIYQKYAVAPHYIVALWAMESDFGRITGKTPVIQALVTLAWRGRRSNYFRQELLNALHIIDKGLIPLTSMRGSWAGAMGQVQFMPSTFLSFAVDGNNDGLIDLWNTEADCLCSAANYLAKLGWKGQQLWGREVQLPPGFTSEQIKFKQQMKLTRWHKLRIRKVDGTDLPHSAMLASLVQPDGSTGRSFLVYNNYRTILKWNRSHKFAIAVGLLANFIGEKTVHANTTK